MTAWQPTALASPAAAAPTGRASLRRRVAAGLAGAVTTSRDARESLDVHAQLTASVPSGRRIVVLGLNAGVGTTTTSALIATAIAGRRSEPVLVVDAARTSVNAPISLRLGASPRRTLAELAADPPHITAREQLAEHLTPLGRDVWLLPGDHAWPSSPGSPGPTAPTYAAAVTGFSRYFDIVITDLGADPEQSAGLELRTGAHALCVVCPASDVGVQYADTVIRGLRDLGGRTWAGRTVILANALDGAAPVSWAARRAARRTRLARIPIVVLPYDPVLAGDAPLAVAGLAPQTHRAALRLGAALLDTAVPRTGRPETPAPPDWGQR
jgi:MinD-like ATPase involved in chromosome partitioning or flagellar assembly